tara:strand:- start:10147 stop:10629 length:483 start_codon:yes stop_codon:yes gene_type:complete
MNIFYLDEDTKIAAKYHNDKHCVKMILEYAQLLCTAHRELDATRGVDENLYKSTHKNHPSAKWVRESAYNYYWLYQLWINLCDEYTHRYGKKHLTDIKLRKLLRNPPYNSPLNIPFTQPPPAMPDDVKHIDSIVAYRNYYKKYKTHLATWTKRDIPSWYH